MRDGTGYVLDNSHVEAGQRFEVMSRNVEEPAEIDRHLDDVPSGRLDLPCRRWSPLPGANRIDGLSTEEWRNSRPTTRAGR
jgi:hypothetical protein